MVVDDTPSDNLREQLLDAVPSVRPADHPTTDRRCKNFAITERNGDGTLTGGVYAYVHPGWTYIDLCWVAESQRSQGLGKKLMAAAEREAQKRGCHSVWLWTQDFEAPGFYEKLGYRRFVVMDDFIPNHQRIGLMKKLVSA